MARHTVLPGGFENTTAPAVNDGLLITSILFSGAETTRSFAGIACDQPTPRFPQPKVNTHRLTLTAQ